MRNDSGAVEFNAVLLLFFIVAIISGGVLFAASGISYLQSDTRYFNNRAEADKLLNTIIEEMQPLSLFQYDDINNALIGELCSKYQQYNLEITDVSSGYHLDFLSEADMADRNVTDFIFKDRTGTAFSTWLRANDLSTSKEPWREFIKDEEEVWDSCVSYGWLHKNDTESFAFRRINELFAVSEINELFPLVNDFPKMNVNMVKPEIIYPLILRRSFNIERARDRANDLVNRLKGGPVLRGDIAATLRIPVNHPIMNYLGTKTSFWKLSFSMPSSLKVEAIVAAFPEKNGAIQEIESYRLINRSFIDD
ncbi:MAG: hypothetical protein LBU88_06965 [Treponema sp.]|jgi:hypothetical protein|nr:hypothetical protein [Treponema sp.]